MDKTDPLAHFDRMRESTKKNWKENEFLIAARLSHDKATNWLNQFFIISLSW